MITLPRTLEYRNGARLRKTQTPVRALAMIIASSLIAHGQQLPRNLKNWQVEFSISGTIKGLDEEVTVDETGRLIASHRHDRSHVNAQAPAELMSKIKAWLPTAKPPKPEPPFPDMLEFSAVVTSGAHRYPLEPPDILRTLRSTFDSLFNQALLGTWRQSGWKLCSPEAQLTASDYDTPIDQLTFRKDGTFTVTWRGGGAHTGDLPHVFLPDYQGTYRSSPELAFLSLKFAHGTVNPRDFSGDGHFTINDDQLTLQNIWLGTRQVNKKPDVCELTFTREASAAAASQ